MGNDRLTAAYYPANGCKMVWGVYPDKHMVKVYQAEVDIHNLLEDDTVDGGDILPGFQMPITEIFT